MSVPTSVAASWPSVTGDQNRSMRRARAADFGTRIVLTWRSFGLIGSGKALTCTCAAWDGELARQRWRSASHSDDSTSWMSQSPLPKVRLGRSGSPRATVRTEHYGRTTGLRAVVRIGNFGATCPLAVSAKVGGAQTSAQVEADDPSGSPRHPIDGFCQFCLGVAS